MWKKIKEQKYLVIIKYYILGIILAVIFFQFVTNSIRNHELDINTLIEKETLKYIVSALVGGIVSGVIFILLTINNKDRQIKEERLWGNLKEKNLLFFIRNIIAFSVGGFVYKIIMNLFDLTGSNSLIQALFSANFIIDYVGIILAMTVFSILISVGIKKRLNLLYGK